MEIEKTVNDGTVTLALSGALTAVTAKQLNTEVEQSLTEAKKLVLDFKDLEYLASAGLRVILNAKRKMDAASGKFIICNASKDVMELFELTGINNVLTFE
jgi:anti-sigma B factor antagonist